MSATALWQDQAKDPKSRRRIKKLLESDEVREALEILAARILLANERAEATVCWPRLPSKNRKIAQLERGIERIKTLLNERAQLPSEEEAQLWLKQWREGTPRKQETKE